jgi:hypothetical protein
MSLDQSSPLTVVAALYAVISGPAEYPRDWHRFRALFLPAARLTLATTLGDGTRS